MPPIGRGCGPSTNEAGTRTVDQSEVRTLTVGRQWEAGAPTSDQSEAEAGPVVSRLRHSRD